MRYRIQKVLAAQGIGSRRAVEAWITAGRLQVNGQVATAGQAIGPGDEVKLDGRRLRLQWQDVDHKPEGVIYHRPPREGLRNALEGAERSSLQRLPSVRAGRWVPVSPMGPGEGGLELFVSDGKLAAALMACAEHISSEYSLRVRGNVDDDGNVLLSRLTDTDPSVRDAVTRLELAGGEGANRWLQMAVCGLRPRDLRRLFEDLGIEVNRVIRTRLGPIVMDHGLARGASRKLTAGEMASLQQLTGQAQESDTGAASPGASGATHRRSRQPPATGSRKPRR